MRNDQKSRKKKIPWRNHQGTQSGPRDLFALRLRHRYRGGVLFRRFSMYPCKCFGKSQEVFWTFGPDGRKLNQHHSTLIKNLSRHPGPSRAGGASAPRRAIRVGKIRRNHQTISNHQHWVLWGWIAWIPWWGNFKRQLLLWEVAQMQVPSYRPGQKFFFRLSRWARLLDVFFVWPFENGPFGR